MKWYDDKFSESSSLILPSLYKVNENIYDEITEISDTECLYKKKCGITKYVENHGYTNFITNGEYIIYELPVSEQSETIIKKNKLISFADSNTTVLYGNTNADFDFALDRRYREYRETIHGKRFGVSTSNLNIADNDTHNIKIYEITADKDNVSSLTVSEYTFELPVILNTGDRLVWQECNKSYVYYPADEAEDFVYYPMNCFCMDSIADSVNETLGSVGELPEVVYNEITDNNKISFSSVNDEPMSKLFVGGDVIQVDDSKLPEGYTEVEYIASTANQYIGTGYYPKMESTKIICDFSFNSKNTQSYQSPFGTRSNADNVSCFYLATDSKWTARNIWIGDTQLTQNGAGSFAWVAGKKYHIEMDRNKYIQDGITYDAPDAMKTSTGIALSELTLFARDNGGTSGVGNFSNSSIFGMKIYEDDVLVKDYVPCVNKNNVLGFYELVDQEFLPSATSTPFNSKGNDILRKKDLGFGGELGKPAEITLKHTYGKLFNDINVNLNTPLLPEETIDLFSGVVNRKYNTISSYNGETITTQWYSSTGELTKGATVAYQVDDYTENITPIEVIETDYDTHTFNIENLINGMECPITVKYDATNYFDYRYKITFNSTDSSSISKFQIHGTTDGVGTHITDDGQNYYNVTLVVQDVNDKNRFRNIEISLNDVLYENDLFNIDTSLLQEIYEKIMEISGTVYLYFKENIPMFSMEYILASNIDANCNILISVPYIEKRDFSKPVVTSNMHVGAGKGYGKLIWDEVYGATEYQLVINDNVFATIDNYVEKLNVFEFNSEIDGTVYVTATNDLEKESQSDTFNILSVPNSTSIEDVDIMYETNKYKISFDFLGNSDICDYYELRYSIDNNPEVSVLIYNTYPYGEIVNYSFYQDDIVDNITIKLLPTNDAGSNDYTPSQKYITVDDFTAWTYKKEFSQILLCWHDMLENESSYLVKYRINRGEWFVLTIDPISGIGNRMLEYIDMDEVSIMDVCLTATIDGKQQIYTKPIRVSKDLDTMLVPPINFTGSRIKYGELEFDWEDNGYTSDHSYELRILNVVTGKTTTIPVPENDDGKYHYTYSMDGYGYVNASVRMVWELGTSDYTKNVLVYNIPVTDTPPKILSKERGLNELTITWEFFDYVKEYVLYLNINGEETIHRQIDFSYTMEIPDDIQVLSINAKVQAVFIDDSETNISDSLIFSICQKSYAYEATIYKNVEQHNPIYSSIYSKGLESVLDVYTVFCNQYTKEHFLFEKSYKTFLEKIYNFYESTWGKGVGDSLKFETIVTSRIVMDEFLHATTYQKLGIDNTIETFIYRPSETEYKLYSEFAKVVIVCLGDSITAGHPNYWAETGTGLINSQYEYWLDRRLKNQFDVINAGYGQEKTNDMLARFDRSVLPYEPQYCIILGGTNDWYQDASTKSLEAGYPVMELAIDNIKEMVNKCWNNNIYPIICTLTPRNDITEDGKVLFDYFNDWVKDFATSQTILGKDCAYIDMFNAGKDFDPPEPLEDPTKPYHLNPLYDGDNVFDENGNQLRSGLGVHMNPEGYRVMGYAIPLNLFKTSDTGIKLYSDSECTVEEKYNSQDISNQYYEISVPNIRRGEEKNIIKYIKNIGVSPTLYYIYITDAHNLKYYFIDGQGNQKATLTGIMNPNLIKPLTLVTETEFEDFTSSFQIHIISRDLTSA